MESTNSYRSLLQISLDANGDGSYERQYLLEKREMPRYEVFYSLRTGTSRLRS